MEVGWFYFFAYAISLDSSSFDNSSVQKLRTEKQMHPTLIIVLQKPF